MSLKAKIEAVIYASEEPVTLAQLTGLLGEEGQAELDALAAQQQTLALDDETTASHQPETEPEASSQAEPATSSEAVHDAPTSEPEIAAAEPSPEPLPPGESPVVDEKKLTREKDRKLREYFRSLLDQLIADYAADARGLEIREVAGGFRLATKPEYHDAVRGFVKSLKPPLKLSLQALETLAVVAYKQPVTAPEISEIRGVDTGGVLGSLMARKLITTAGRKQVIGRPILYKTTREFLFRFGLKDINELPSIEEFEKMAGELTDLEPVQEEIPMDIQAGSADYNDFVPRTASAEPEPAGTPTSLDEIGSAPEPTTTLHEDVEDILSDDSTSPEGARREHTDKKEVDIQAAQAVEPSAETHEAQADGDPGEAPAETPADDILIDGRISGPPPPADDHDPSALDAEIQSNSKTGGA